jgi:HK97 gp10 family phage protein
MKAKITVKGSDQLRAAFKRVQAAARDEVLAQAAYAGILPINNAAQAKAPYLTGNLRRSIHPELVERQSTYAEAATGTDVDYAARQEFGFEGVDALGREYHQPARPYMRPAYDEQRGAAIQAASDALADAIKAVS